MVVPVAAPAAVPPAAPVAAPAATPAFLVLAGQPLDRCLTAATLINCEASAGGLEAGIIVPVISTRLPASDCNPTPSSSTVTFVVSSLSRYRLPFFCRQPLNLEGAAAPAGLRLELYRATRNHARHQNPLGIGHAQSARHRGDLHFACASQSDPAARTGSLGQNAKVARPDRIAAGRVELSFASFQNQMVLVNTPACTGSQRHTSSAVQAQFRGSRAGLNHRTVEKCRVPRHLCVIDLKAAGRHHHANRRRARLSNGQATG